MSAVTPGLDALAEAARAETARVYGSVVREHRQPERPELARFERLPDSYYGPPPTSVLNELLDAIVPAQERTSRMATVARIEQAIACGYPDGQIARDLHIARSAVEDVRAAMDKVVGL